MTYETVLVSREGGVERLTLNRPQVRNAFNEAMVAELAAWAERAARDPSLEIVILRGAGAAFAAGADASWMAQTVTWSRERNLEDATRLSRMFAAINRLPVPVIGCVHGAALGGGAGLAAVCDIVVAATDAIFGFTEVKLGLIPAVISPFVLARIGPSAARELFLTGARFTAARAREIGLVHRVVEASQLDATVDELVGELRSSGREALTAAKALIADVMGAATPEAVEALTASAIADRRVSAEGQEGLRAFLEKRRPAWRRG